MNAWALLYDVLNGTLDENFPTMTNKNENDPITNIQIPDDYFTMSESIDGVHLAESSE